MEKDRPDHHVIESLEITGADFVGGVKLELALGYTCISGPKGSGKTTVLEAMGFVLESKGPSRHASLLEANLGNGRVRLRVRTKHGVRYTAERAWNGETQIFDENGEPKPISFDRDGVFAADVYSTHEIEEIATNAALQLALLDRQADEEIRRIGREIDGILGSLRQNAGDLLRINESRRALEDRAAEVSRIEEKMRGLEAAAGPDAKRLASAHAGHALRQKEKNTLEAISTDLQEATSAYQIQGSKFLRRLGSRIDSDVVSGPNEPVFAALSSELQSVAKLVEKTTAKLIEECERVSKRVGEESRSLGGRHAKQELEYRDLVERSKEESSRAEDRAKTQKELLDATTARKDLDTLLNERRSHLAARKKLIDKLSKSRHERFLVRARVAANLTKSLRGIQVGVHEAGDRDDYRTILTEALRKQPTLRQYSHLVTAITRRLRPDELVELVEGNATARLATVADIREDQAEKIVAILSESERLYDIETVDVPEAPLIELLDGEAYKPSDRLSTGQRCTAILPILLRESDRPLLIDQPEDNLDASFLYDRVVKILKEDVKNRRQIIFVSHSPNLVVLGEPDRVFVMQSDGKHASVAASGTVDEMKEHIVRFLEGGAEAFQRRREKYGHP